MNEIIKISNFEIGNEVINSVNARDIHNYLQVKTAFAHWINRAITKYDFKENIDFVKIDKPLNNQKDYIVTLDMAKELAMLENNLKGREIRKYFIKVEKDYISSLQLNKQNILDAEIYKKKYFEAIERENELLRNMLSNDLSPIMKPSIANTNFTTEEIEQIKELKKQGFSIRQIAKIINRSPSGVYNYVSTFMEISYKKKSIVEEMKKIKELLEKGHTAKEISAILNKSVEIIYNRLRRIKNEQY